MTLAPLPGPFDEPVAKPEKARASLREVRAWARKRGITVGQRGHLPEALIKSYNRTHHKRATSQNPWKGQ